MLLILNSNSLNYYTRIQKINQSINLEGNKKGQKVVPYRIGLDLKKSKESYKYFYNRLFQYHIPVQVDSIYITFPVPIGSSKKQKRLNFIPTHPRKICSI